MHTTCTLWPSSRNLRPCTSRYSRSCGSMAGRTRSSFRVECVLDWPRSFFFCAYLNLPKSITRQTGGSAFGWTSTRSSPASSAMRRASSVETTPTCSLAALIRRTWGTRICRLTRYLLVTSFLLGGSLFKRGAALVSGWVSSPVGASAIGARGCGRIDRVRGSAPVKPRRHRSPGGIRLLQGLTRELDVDLGQLLRLHRGGRLAHQVGGRGGLREGDHVADVVQ